MTITTGQASDTDTMQVSDLIDASAPQAGVNDTEKDSGLPSDGRFEETEAIDKDFEANDSIKRPEDKHNKNAEAQTGANAFELSMGNSDCSNQKSATEKSLTNANGKNSNGSVASMGSQVKVFSLPNFFKGRLAHTSKGHGGGSEALSSGSPLQFSSDSFSQSRQESHASSTSLKKHTQDSYSFLSLHGPFDEPIFFGMGIMVWCFQLSLVGMMLLSVLHPKWGMRRDDNPADDVFARIIAANASPVVQATQFIAILAYVLFADASLLDVTTAVETFPKFSKVANGDKVGCMVFSCMLRFLQGFLAMCATFLLIITSETAVDVVLNFSAVNFISSLDNVAFQLALSGKYGEKIKHEAKRITKLQLPPCMSPPNHTRFRFTLVTLGLIFVTFVGGIIFAQVHPEFWSTTTLRVQFWTAELQTYSGCYELDWQVEHHNRWNYNGYVNNAESGFISYCNRRQQWILFKTSAGNIGDYRDPCNITREDELAYSANTDSFDISTAFEGGWYSTSGTPLDLYFFDTEDSRGVDLKEKCKLFLNDGVCDISFNNAVTQYDGGDCCASTCTQSNCGFQGITSAFGAKNIAGIGYPYCINPDMVPLTIYLNDMKSSRDKSVLSVTEIELEDYERERGVDFWSEPPVTPLFIIDCDEKNLMTIYVDESMKHHSETIMVNDGAWCRITITNTTSTLQSWDNDPIWWINFTIYHGNETSDEIITGYSGDQESLKFHRIPECYFETLEEFVNVSRAYIANNADSNALSWLATDESVYSSCADKFLVERFALAMINYAAPIVPDFNSIDEDTIIYAAPIVPNYGINEDILWITPQQQCHWIFVVCNLGSVEALTVRSLPLNGTIASSIGLLTGLKRMVYDGNGLTGTIPTEIGMLTRLTGLDIDNNKLTGTIPTELGKLKKMIELDLDQNNLNGTIPTEFGHMVNAREFDLIYNQLSGPIPTEIGKLKLMTTFAAEGNNLSGTIPSEIGNMAKIAGLNLANNNITGRIPHEIRNARSSLKELLLQDNDMTGTIPSDIGRLTQLEQLVLDGNGFSGTLPSEMGTMTSLSLLSIRENNFRGTIPTEIGFLTNLREIRLEGNALSGKIPVEIVLLERLQILTFDDGVLPIAIRIPGNIKTSSQCLLCEGQNYELQPGQNNDDKVYYENGTYGIVKAYSCRTLLELKWRGEGLWSANACNILKNICVTCGSGDYYDDN